MSLATGMTLSVGEKLALMAPGRQGLPMAIPVSMALHGAVIAAIAFGWQFGAAELAAEAPMDVVVVMETAAASEAPVVARAAAPEPAPAPKAAEPPPAWPPQPVATPAQPSETVAVALPEPEALPPAVTETAFVMPVPPPALPRAKPAPPPTEMAAAPPPPPEPVRDRAREIAAAALPPAEPGPARESTAPDPKPADAVASAATPSFRGLPLVTEARFREPPRQPAYPRRAIDLDQKGTVVVRALVDPAGNPATIEIWSSSGHPLLDRAAEQAVRQWRFQPATYNARPTEAWVQVAVHFNLR